MTDEAQAAPAEDVTRIAAELTDIASLLAGDYAYKQADTCREAAHALISLSAERDHYAASELAGVEKARELFKRLEASEAEATALRRKLEEHRRALEHVRAIISEGAMVGFNPLDGTWAERLYASQGMTHAVLNPARGASE